MRSSLILLAVLGSFGLTGCIGSMGVSPADMAKSRCESYGHKAGTSSMATCIGTERREMKEAWRRNTS